MAARVIHFGYDDCYRVQVLRTAGYEVRQPTWSNDYVWKLGPRTFRD